MKILKVTVLLIIIALIIGVLYIFSNLNGLVKQGVEEVGSQVLKTPVSLSQVDISLLENRARLSGLKVANIQGKGYAAANIFELNDIIVDLKVSSLLQKVIEVENITIDGALIAVEQKGLNTNVQDLQKNIGSGTATSGTDQGDGTSTASPDLLIKVGQFQFSNNKVTLITDKWGEQGLTIPTIELKKIGGDKGVTPEGLAQAITTPLLKQLKAAIEDGVKEAAKEKAKEKLREEEDKAKAKLRKKLDEKLGEGGADKLKALLGR